VWGVRSGFPSPIGAVTMLNNVESPVPPSDGEMKGDGMKGKRLGWKRYLGLLILGLGSLVLAGCRAPGDPLWLDAPAWGRAQYVRSIPEGQSFSFFPGPDDTLYFLFPVADGSYYQADVFVLDEHLDTVWERRLDLDLPFPNQVDMLLVGDQLHILWAGGGDLQRIHMNASGEGDISLKPANSPFELLAFTTDIAPDGDLQVFAAGDEDDPGVYALRDEIWILIDPAGVSPQILFDAHGALHAIWLHDDRLAGDNGIYYAGFSGGIPYGGKQMRIAELALNPADGLDGPGFGVEDGLGYIFWTQLYRTGLRAGTMEARALTFGMEDPLASARESVLTVPDEFNMAYERFPEGDLRAGFRSPWLAASREGTATITDVDVLMDEGEELALALRARVSYLRRKQQWQVGILFMDAGQTTSYQLLSFSPGNSSTPILQADHLGYLHLAWLEYEGDSGGQLYYSSTAPAFQRTLTELELADYKNAIGATLFGMLSGMVMIPIGLIWLVLPFLMMVLTSRLREESQDLTSLGERISLALIVLTYWAARQAFFPGMWQTVPFQTWWPMMPDTLGEILRLGLPFLVTLLSLWVAWRNIYERGHRSFLYFSMFYLAMDALVIMAIYGETVLAVF